MNIIATSHSGKTKEHCRAGAYRILLLAIPFPFLYTHFMANEIYQVLMIGLEGTELTGQEKAYLRDYSPGGVILFGRNCETAEQVAALCAEIYRHSVITPFIAIDEEGGIVRRLRKLYDSIDDLQNFAETAGGANIELFGLLNGRLLRSLGINLNLAPVVDLHFNDADNALRRRYWSSDTSKLVQRTRAFLRGQRSAGIHGCLKHFPGLGRALVDSHFVLPTSSASMIRLKSSDMVPFKLLHSLVPAIMLAHCAFSQITGAESVPSSVVPAFYKELRETIGFSDIAITDDLGMKAIADLYNTVGIIEKAIEAGANMLPFCNEFDVIAESFRLLEDSYKASHRFAHKVDTAARQILRTKQQCGLRAEMYAPDLEQFAAAKPRLEQLAGEYADANVW